MGVKQQAGGSPARANNLGVIAWVVWRGRPDATKKNKTKFKRRSTGKIAYATG